LLESATQHITFDDNSLLLELLGPADGNLKRIENRFGVAIAARGNHLAITGAEQDVGYAKNTLQYLYAQLNKGSPIDSDALENAIRIVGLSVNLTPSSISKNTSAGINTKRRMIFPRSENQAEYLHMMQTKDLIFSNGPAGTGKTYLAVAVGVSMLLSGKIERIILTRPAVEAGEKLGFLPGDMREKVDPYLRPLYDAMNDMLTAEQVEKRINSGEIEVAPLAFMRGRTLANAFVILDEAQNTTPVQMKMFLTRLGNNSHMVVTGDLTQIDLPTGIESGLSNAMRILQNVPDIAFINFNETDVVRHPIVSKIVSAYAKAEKNK
jgi:phosphate starvation-inducible PhoH-like protein